MIDPVNIALGALGTLWLTHLAHRLFFDPRRVHGASATGVHGRSTESTLASGVHGDDDAPGRGRPGRVPGPVQPDHGRAAVAFDTAEPAPTGFEPVIHMGVKDTIDEFVLFMLSGDPPYVLTHAEWLTQFKAWGREKRIVLMPDSIFLRAFREHPWVTKDRARKKRRDGSVVRLDTEARSPVRPVVYILEQPRALPGRVPVGDLVAAQPIKTKKQRDAEKAAAAAVHHAPEQIAA